MEDEIKYRAKSIEDTFWWRFSNQQELYEFFERNNLRSYDFNHPFSDDLNLAIDSEYSVRVPIGDWVVRVEGQFFCVPCELFEKIYEAIQ